MPGRGAETPTKSLSERFGGMGRAVLVVGTVLIIASIVPRSCPAPDHRRIRHVYRRHPHRRIKVSDCHPWYEAGSTDYVVVEQLLFVLGGKDVDEPHLGCRVDLGRSKRHVQSLPVAVRTVAQGDRCVHHS